MATLSEKVTEDQDIPSKPDGILKMLVGCGCSNVSDSHGPVEDHTALGSARAVESTFGKCKNEFTCAVGLVLPIVVWMNRSLFAPYEREG
jgi:hypothetical protein